MSKIKIIYTNTQIFTIIFLNHKHKILYVLHTCILTVLTEHLPDPQIHNLKKTQRPKATFQSFTVASM